MFCKCKGKLQSHEADKKPIRTITQNFPETHIFSSRQDQSTVNSRQLADDNTKNPLLFFSRGFN